jgi:hypothetical protein
MIITNIYKTTFQNYSIQQKYQGLLRNAKRFNIGDSVFIGYGDDCIFRATIRGVTLDDDFQNPEFVYKVEIPREMAIDEDDKYRDLICDKIFNTIEEAKSSRLTQAKRLYDLEVENINSFFKKFEI